MKKIVLTSATAFLLFSCNNIQNYKHNSNQIIKPTVKNIILKQENFYLNDSGVFYLYDLIQRDASANKIRQYQPYQINSPLELYIGETLVINNMMATNIKILASPVKTGYLFEIKNNVLTFSSPYQGEYIAEIYNNLTCIGTIKIKNKLKYYFTEADNYDIILNSYNNKNLDLLTKSTQLYLMAFPIGNKQKNILFMLIDLASSTNNASLINSKIKYLEDNFYLSENEKLKVLSYQEKLNDTGFNIDDYFLDYNKNYMNLNNKIVEIITKKDNATQKELDFLEKYYQDTQNPNLAKLIGTLYIKNGDTKSGDYYIGLANLLPNLMPKLPNTVVTNNKYILNNNNDANAVIEPPTSIKEYSKALSDGIDALNRQSYNEAIIFFNKAEMNSNNSSEINFFRGKSYFMLQNYSKALSNFKKIIDTTNNKSELYYYIGVIYHKQGNFKLAKKYLRDSRENSPSSIWGRKSSIYLLKL